MKKLTPKGIIGLSSTAFLFLILMSIIYLNDQVEFNAIEAKWQLQEPYINTLTTQEFIQVEYDLDYLLNTDYNYATFQFQTNSEFTSTALTPIINDTLILEDTTDVTFIHFFDSSQNYIGRFASINSDHETGWLGDINNYSTLPNNAEYFILVGFKFDVVPNWRPNTLISQQEFIENEKYYIESQINIIDRSYYQVFENIRNNASTVNPLGFMNTLVSIPSQAVGYMRSFTQFINFDLKESITEWGVEKVLGPESGYWEFVEWFQGLGD